MMSPIGLYLAEFAPRTAALSLSGPGFPCHDGLDQPAVSAEEAAGSRLDQARAEAFAEGRADAEAACEAQLADLERRHAAHLAEERQRWAEQQGAVLAETLEKGLRDLEGRLAAALAEILEPFLDRSLRVKAATDLHDAIERLLANSDTPAVEVTGPADLVEPLRTAFASRAGVRIVAADVPEVTVLAGDTTIASQLQAWRSGLMSAVGEDR